MITGQLKNQIDKLWLEFYVGGITNPLTVIEQISFLMFVRLLDIQESRRERQLARKDSTEAGVYSANQQHLRWSSFRHLGGDMFPIVRDEVFPFLRDKLKANGHRGGFTTFFQDASLLIPKPTLLV